MSENRNFILAIALSLAVLVGWQYFVAGPQMEKSRQEAARQEQTTTAPQPAPAATPAPGSAPVPATPAPGDAGIPGAVPSAAEPAATILTRDQVLAASPRVPIATERLSGSVNLRGGRIDDLHLTDFHETVDDNSPTIVLLSPTGGPDGYFAEFGWIGTGANGPALPGPDTVWTAPGNAKLTSETPLELTHDNGAGLTFTRTIAVDKNYMFTVTDAVTNNTGAEVSLVPYGRVTRIGLPVTQGWYILHEGLIGVFGDEGLQEVHYSALDDEPQITQDGIDRGWLGITDKYWATAMIPEKGRKFDARFAKFDQLLIDWGWFYFITKPLFLLIDFLFRIFGNFGVAILLVTVLIKGVFFPLANKSYKSMSMMKKVQPQMLELRERYKDDRVKQQQALMELYKKEKINPVAGCWPMLIQVPVFFALYKVLFVTIEMRHAPFFGWIQDLAAPDPTSIFNLFGLLPWAVPAFLLIGVWPIIMGITMFFQMKLNPAPTDPTQQMIFNWMPLIFTFMLATFPAGLVIYWAWNNTLSVIQQYVIMRRQGVKVELWDNLASMFKRKPKKADASG
jgi:YidC/Oxa1 family membrane protein insertase